MGSVDGYNIILNLIQLFSISAGIKKSPGDVVVKDIKSTSPFKPKLLKKLKVSNGKLFKDRKTHLNITAIFSTHTPIIKTEGIRLNVKSLTARL